MKKFKTKDYCLLAILIGLNVVLSRFLSINAWDIKIGFTFLTIYVAAYIYGPIGGVLVGGLGDLVGSLMFPTGPYYPGFTLTAILTGVLFGLLLKDNSKTKNIFIACIINEFIVNLLVNTYWISVLYDTSYSALLLTRIFQAIIKCIVGIISITLLSKVMPSLKRRLK